MEQALTNGRKDGWADGQNRRKQYTPSAYFIYARGINIHNQTESALFVILCVSKGNPF